MKKDFKSYELRREDLIQEIKQKYPDKTGLILLFAGFENERYRFKQENSLYYFSGLEEPGIVLSISTNGSTTVYLAQYSESRNKWVSSNLYNTSKESLILYGINNIKYLGKPCKGYSIKFTCTETEYEDFIKDLKEHISLGHYIFTTYSDRYSEQRLLIDQFINIIPELKDYIIDISDIIAQMRKTKSKFEIEQIYKAIDCTMAAQETAAQLIEPDKYENEIQAGIEFIFIQSGASAAFPSIVASGKNATVLHYNLNRGLLKKGDLVIVDIGAEIDYYCADLTRTYPVSGVFSKRQKELYNIVLETQSYIESLAKPGYWLNNKNEPKKSLQHLAYEFLDKMGYGKYFTHGIGHFLGMDVHDVGDYLEPLKEGDVITIEPGIYIPEENTGIRIEDNYWIVKDGNICLSEALPKDPNLIEELMAQELEDEDYED